MWKRAKKVGGAVLVCGAAMAITACNQDLPPTNGVIVHRVYTPASTSQGELILGDPASEGPIESNATWELWVRGTDHEVHTAYVGPKVFAKCQLGATWRVRTSSC